MSFEAYRYWLRMLAPYARAGYRRGYIDDSTVVLVRADGARVVIPRPGRWTQADAALERHLDDEPGMEVDG